MRTRDSALDLAVNGVQDVRDHRHSIVRPRASSYVDRAAGESGRDGRGCRVTILGAGIAGLVAAYELEQRGFDVEVFEGSDRIGGRIHTFRFGSDPEAPFA